MSKAIATTATTAMVMAVVLDELLPLVVVETEVDVVVGSVELEVVELAALVRGAAVVTGVVGAGVVGGSVAGSVVVATDVESGVIVVVVGCAAAGAANDRLKASPAATMTRPPRRKD